MPVVSKQSPKAVKPNGKSGFLAGIRSIDELEETGYKFLCFGSSGSGKTTLAASFPKPLLMVRPERAEDGTMSIRTVPGIDVTPYMTTPDHLNEIIEQQKESGHYKTIVLDGVTKFQDLVLKKVLDLSETPEQLSWGIANQQTWGIVSNELKEHLRKLLQLSEEGTHIVIVGGERSLNTDNENAASLLAPTVMIALTPSSMGWLHEVTDYSVHTFIRRKRVKKEMIIGGKKQEKEVTTDDVEFCCRTSPDPIYQIKFRVPRNRVLPKVVVDPTFAKLNALIRGEKS